MRKVNSKGCPFRVTAWVKAKEGKVGGDEVTEGVEGTHFLHCVVFGSRCSGSAGQTKQPSGSLP